MDEDAGFIVTCGHAIPILEISSMLLATHSCAYFGLTLCRNGWTCSVYWGSLRHALNYTCMDRCYMMRSLVCLATQTVLGVRRQINHANEFLGCIVLNLVLVYRCPVG